MGVQTSESQMNEDSKDQEEQMRKISRVYLSLERWQVLSAAKKKKSLKWDCLTHLTEKNVSSQLLFQYHVCHHADHGLKLLCQEENMNSTKQILKQQNYILATRDQAQASSWLEAGMEVNTTIFSMLKRFFSFQN